MTTPEQRSNLRETIALTASYQAIDEPVRAEGSMIVNLSRGGFCFKSGSALNVGRKLKLSVQISKTEEVVLDVAVVWCTRLDGEELFKIGTQIINPEGRDFERFLDFYCDKIRKKYMKK